MSSFCLSGGSLAGHPVANFLPVRSFGVGSLSLPLDRLNPPSSGWLSSCSILDGISCAFQARPCPCASALWQLGLDFEKDQIQAGEMTGPESPDKGSMYWMEEWLVEWSNVVFLWRDLSLPQQGDLSWNYPAVSIEIWLQTQIPRVERSVAAFVLKYISFSP